MITIFAVRGEGELETNVTVDDLPRLLEDAAVNVWVDLSGPMDDLALKVVRDIFHFHPLAIEDTINYLIFHEGLHVGYIMPLKRLVRRKAMTSN